MEIYIGLILIMSSITFVLYEVDKRKAKDNKWRIKEIVLLVFSFLFGSIGGLLGMYGLRHKTKHWHFVAVNYLSLIIHILIGIIIFKRIGMLYI